MKFIKSLFICLSLATFVSCGGDQSPEKNKTEDVETVTVELSLNNGKKWVINDEMTPHINRMEESLQYLEGQSVDDFKKLGMSLKENLKQLITSCTMSGASHEELHKWLGPFAGTVNDLAEVKDSRSGKRLYLELMDAFTNFHTYFK